MRDLLIICLSIVLLASCSKDDDDDGTSLVGAYNFDRIEANNCAVQGLSYVLDFDGDECATATGIEFCQDGTMNFAADGTVTSTLTLMDNITGIPGISFNGEGTYVLNDNMLSVCINNICTDFEVDDDQIIAEESVSGCEGRVVLEKI